MQGSEVGVGQNPSLTPMNSQTNYRFIDAAKGCSRDGRFSDRFVEEDRSGKDFFIYNHPVGRSLARVLVSVNRLDGGSFEHVIQHCSPGAWQK